MARRFETVSCVYWMFAFLPLNLCLFVQELVPLQEMILVRGLPKEAQGATYRREGQLKEIGNTPRYQTGKLFPTQE